MLLESSVSHGRTIRTAIKDGLRVPRTCVYICFELRTPFHPLEIGNGMRRLRLLDVRARDYGSCFAIIAFISLEMSDAFEVSSILYIRASGAVSWAVHDIQLY